MSTDETFVLSTGSALPGDPIDNTALAERFGVNAQWVELFVGTRTRHFAVDLGTAEQTHTLADLAAAAGAQAMSRAGLEPTDLDFVVLATATPDTLMPATVNVVADRLGVDQVATYQLQSGCAGAIQALDIGRKLLDDEHRTGLVIGGDVCAKHLVLDRDTTGQPPSELINYVLFGDGAGAVVLSADAEGATMRLDTVLNRFTGLGRDPAQVIHWWGETGPTPGVQAVTEDYKAIEERVPGMAVEVLYELLDRCGWDKGELSFLLPPQLSGRMTQRIVKDLAVDSATEVSVVADTGNNGNALPFLQLDALAPQIRAGQRAAAVAIESSKWLKGGFTLEGL
ncbi:3-oxoacyl-ACP synthase III family protein [Actinokineospora spheciospongiae]|uniref:3-oxoacyl-ACP synthase III family protein n=1 Tax=Actinokineospora spheciospongiae TaxID=909613 RepID=UPI000D717DFB|nr:3-oxoacyl-ACP synthase III family protein [Actinokineospora spheciospongiae]PWW53048.1 3-oxoacyl-[acyl-carrier-protein] synthase-3 [Actinokineospora spheciospongiae]